MWRLLRWLWLLLASATACVPLPAVTLAVRAGLRTSSARSERRLEARMACAWSLEPRLARSERSAEPEGFAADSTFATPNASEELAPCVAGACAWERAARADALIDLADVDARSLQGEP